MLARYIYSSALASLLSRLTGLGVSIVISGISFRYLKEDDLAIFLLIIGATNFVSFSDLGLGNSLVNKIIDISDRAKKLSKLNEYLKKSLFISLFYIVAALIVVLFGESISNVYMWSVFLVYLSLSVPLSLVSKYRLSNKDIKTDQFLFSIGRILSLVLCCIAIWLEFNVIFIVSLYLLGDLLYKGLNTFLVFDNVSIEKNEENIFDIRFLKYFLFQLFYVLIFTGDMVLVKSIYSNLDVSVYFATSRIFDLIPVITMMIVSPLWPVLRKGELTSLDVNIMTRIIVSVIFLVACAFACLNVIGEYLFNAWLGDNYEFSLVLVNMLFLQAITISLFHASNVYLQSKEKISAQILIASSWFFISLFFKLTFQSMGSYIFPMVNSIVIIIVFFVFLIWNRYDKII
ncbi:TPA: hypothetical protein ACF38V_003101 [Vibrio parahaemolyticus]